MVLQILCAAALTSFTFFLVDDYEFLAQARTQSLTLTYLREGLYEHFSPLSRLLDKLLVVAAPGDWALAHGIELALYAMALVAFALVMRTLLGNSWSAFAFTLVFGQSIFLIRLLYWWTATANILPATIFTLLSLACYLRWRETGSRVLLTASFAAFAVALLDYETALLFPAYLVLIRLVVIERRPVPRVWLASLWRERWAWAGYVVLDAAALANYYSFYYHRPAQPSFAQVAHFLQIALLQTFVPALVGVRPTQAPLVAVATGLVVLTAVVVTLYLRPRAWRCLAAFVAVFVITMLPVGINKIAGFGVAIGEVLYYQQSVQFMFLVLAAFAISPRWSGQRARPALGRLRGAAGGRSAFTIRRPRPRALALAGAVAVAAYAALYVTSLRALTSQVWQEGVDRAYVREYLASDRRVRAALGHEPVLVDLDVPTHELPGQFGTVPSYGVFLALFNPNLRVDDLAKPLHVLSSRGRLVPVSFVALTRGVLAEATVTAGSRSAQTAAYPRSSSSACAPVGRSASWSLHVPLASTQQLRAPANGLSYALRVGFRMPLGANVSVRLVAWRGGRGYATVSAQWGRGPGAQLIPLQFSGALRELDFQLPAGACVSGLAVGRLRFTHTA